MKNALKTLLAALLSLSLLATTIISPCAEHYDSEPANATNTSGGASTYLTNCSNATFVFSVVDDNATFVVSYIGRESSFVMARLKVQVQKKMLGLFWIDVGEQWIEDCEDLDGRFYGTVPANGTGKYRANFILHVVGNTGYVDVIEDTIECEYD